MKIIIVILSSNKSRVYGSSLNICFFQPWTVTFKLMLHAFPSDLCVSLCVSAGWKQAVIGWSRWTTWWSWVVSRTPCVSSPMCSLSTTTCASLSEAHTLRIFYFCTVVFSLSSSLWDVQQQEVLHSLYQTLSWVQAHSWAVCLKMPTLPPGGG